MKLEMKGQRLPRFIRSTPPPSPLGEALLGTAVRPQHRLQALLTAPLHGTLSCHPAPGDHVTLLLLYFKQGPGSNPTTPGNTILPRE